mmetsp:Transcript_6704/g.9947  ORF Transcript_6704/g.9947 Transcript_6704/m.9947 type:complete len:224 (+) Transcript_6704:1642-2313(+)
MIYRLVRCTIIRRVIIPHYGTMILLLRIWNLLLLLLLRRGRGGRMRKRPGKYHKFQINTILIKLLILQLHPCLKIFDNTTIKLFKSRLPLCKPRPMQPIHTTFYRIDALNGTNPRLFRYPINFNFQQGTTIIRFDYDFTLSNGNHGELLLHPFVCMFTFTFIDRSTVTARRVLSTDNDVYVNVNVNIQFIGIECVGKSLARKHELSQYNIIEDALYLRIAESL